MTEYDLKQLLDPVIQVAYQAGRQIMEIYEGGFSVEEKLDKTPVTEADMVAHQVIETSLEKLTPNIPILSEESKPISFSERQKWPCYWLIDPLDGTWEFIKRNGEFTVNIALIDGNNSVMGVVYAPITDELYYAIKGQGAFKQKNSHKAEAIYVREKCPEIATIVCGHSRPTEKFINFTVRLKAYKIIRIGSALKSCLIAEGKADLYARFGLTSEWDTAAAQCIVEEAGGVIADTRMQRLRYNTKDELLNPHFFVFGDKSIDWSNYL